MTSLKNVARPVSLTAFVRGLDLSSLAGWAWVPLVFSLLALSLLAGLNFDTQRRLYVAGEIADNDVVADHNMLMEDEEATTSRRKQVMSTLPSVYDLTLAPYNDFQVRLTEALRAINSPDQGDDTAVNALLSDVPEASRAEVLQALTDSKVQGVLMRTLMPKIYNRLSEGLVGDLRTAHLNSSEAVIHHLDNDTETLRRDVRSLPDLPAFLAELSSDIRNEKSLTPSERKALNDLLAAHIRPTLTLNVEATQRRSTQIANSVSPVYYQIYKGEVILRRGERVNREHQLKLQALYRSGGELLQVKVVAGAFLCSLLFSLGFFMSPSGKRGTPLRRKDIWVIAILLLFFGLAAKAVSFYGSHLASPSLLNSFAVAFPIAGGVGLVAMIFGARRYLTMALLMSFFTMLIFNGGIELFVYYFLGGMLSTWLVTRSQSRQDVVWSLVPLLIGLLLVWLGTFFLGNAPVQELPIQAIAVLISALLSLILLFAVSPVLEMAFHFSTRFRLMELMSLEQPLMQEIMVSIPGTYHHSLVVANMVEAGAKAIGANSLLCKVAALYHDAGKLSYPEYFIENQFGTPNKHDKLAPSMSALILLAHVKKGQELAEKYKLGEDIADIIRQHHGTRQMTFFYQKALNMGEKPVESDYRYPGPRPQSKEAAILMLADSVEASSRTLTDPTPARIRTHIDNIVKGIFAEGQLDESELTFQDLHHISESFLRILTGIFHQRIAYPEKRLKQEQGKAGAHEESKPASPQHRAPDSQSAPAETVADKSGNLPQQKASSPSQLPPGESEPEN